MIPPTLQRVPTLPLPAKVVSPFEGTQKSRDAKKKGGVGKFLDFVSPSTRVLRAHTWGCDASHV